MDTPATQTRDPRPRSETDGIDVPAERPGVPMEATPVPATGVDGGRPERQRNSDQHLHHAGIDRPTPVVGTAQPPRGVSGMMRKAAYEIPEHYARHWMILMAADRVDVLEDRLGGMLAEPMERVGFDAGARYARANPLAVLAGTLVGAWVAKKVIF